MSLVLTMSLAVVIDGLLGEPRRWHPLVGFGRVASALEHRLARPQTGAPEQRLRGTLAAVLAIAPAVMACFALRMSLATGAYAGLAFDVLMLWLALGQRSLRDHALAVREALRRDDLDGARHAVGRIVSRDCTQLDAVGVSRATVESVLENGSDAVFGALFWFAIAGSPGVIAYRLCNTLDAMWGYRTPRHVYFGRFAARLDDLMNFIPARLTALSYALLGRTGSALRCWRTQARHWESPNAGPVMAAGAGALLVQLGGPARYHGEPRFRPMLGTGAIPQVGDIDRSLRLVHGSVVLWLACLWLLARWSGHA
ncbi:adenosylcobinamide-phosphate synthase CbiB [Algiphilus sp. W345]|uniref:Cobalamin biosynthesis protein CobD n=1 Tax=Banduia mediterranea TaxID=3075609 RepID=A0ABU2WH68_9GAMM|nr:adenosylcobinamide-phosphate synthase CbiB [Algiphilus sp. W345]MDT0497212.1 adenosylcobinamide-phosphate synthase CbiB [Algiphilus sp. W345]